jgi:hypothetical protein
VPGSRIDSRRSINIVVNGGVNSFDLSQPEAVDDDEVDTRLKELQDHIEMLIGTMSEDNRVLKRQLTTLAANITVARTGKRKRTADTVETMTRRLRQVLEGERQA